MAASSLPQMNMVGDITISSAKSGVYDGPDGLRGNTNHIGEAVFTVEITDIFNFKTEFEYFRTEQPLPRQDGSIPKSNDFQLIVGFSVRVG